MRLDPQRRQKLAELEELLEEGLRGAEALSTNAQGSAFREYELNWRAQLARDGGRSGVEVVVGRETLDDGYHLERAGLVLPWLRGEWAGPCPEGIRAEVRVCYPDHFESHALTPEEPTHFVAGHAVTAKFSDDEVTVECGDGSAATARVGDVAFFKPIGCPTAVFCVVSGSRLEAVEL